MSKYFKLSTESIKTIVSIIQQGMLKDTDVTDQLKGIELVENGNDLVPFDNTENSLFTPCKLNISSLIHIVDLITVAYVVGEQFQYLLAQLRFEKINEELMLTKEYIDYFGTYIKKLEEFAVEQMKLAKESENIEVESN